jgi:hypothetical protein
MSPRIVLYHHCDGFHSLKYRPSRRSLHVFCSAGDRCASRTIQLCAFAHASPSTTAVPTSVRALVARITSIPLSYSPASNSNVCLTASSNSNVAAVTMQTYNESSGEFFDLHGNCISL